MFSQYILWAVQYWTLFRQTPNAAALELLRHVFKIRRKLLTLRETPNDLRNDAPNSSAAAASSHEDEGTNVDDIRKPESTATSERSSGRRGSVSSMYSYMTEYDMIHTGMINTVELYATKKNVSWYLSRGKEGKFTEERQVQGSVLWHHQEVRLPHSLSQRGTLR